jgi:hypothetical protein
MRDSSASGHLNVPNLWRGLCRAGVGRPSPFLRAMCQGGAVKESRLIEQARPSRLHARLPPALLFCDQEGPAIGQRLHHSNRQRRCCVDVDRHAPRTQRLTAGVALSLPLLYGSGGAWSRFRVAVRTREIYHSANGDRWLLARDAETGRVFVRHEPNLPSGGQVADIEIGAFLIAGGNGPEKQELLRLIGTLV